MTTAFDGTDPVQMNAAIDAIVLAATGESAPEALEPVSESLSLFNIPARVYLTVNALLKAGKRHLLFYGPPGTGKTELAMHVARHLSSGSIESAVAGQHWSIVDVVGGYQPIGGGKLAFVKGLILRNFDKPIVIDELNRCDIDKVLGPLFALLNGNPTTLPFRGDPADESAEFVRLFPSPVPAGTTGIAATRKWRLVATMNTVDRSEVAQMSYALSRRFGWVYVGVPDNPKEVLRKVAVREGYIDDGTTIAANPIGDAWLETQRFRQLGAAPFIDMLRFCASAVTPDELFKVPNANVAEAIAAAFTSLVVPLLAGVISTDLEILGDRLVATLGLLPASDTATALKGALAEIV